MTKKYARLATDAGRRFHSGTDDLVRPGRHDFNIPPIVSERTVSTEWASDGNFKNFASVNAPRMFHSRLAGFSDANDPEEGRMSALAGPSAPARVDPAAYRSFARLERDVLAPPVDPGTAMNKTDFADSRYAARRKGVAREGYEPPAAGSRGRVELIEGFDTVVTRDSERDIDRRDEIFVNVIQPGVYSINDVTEAVDNNFGINESRRDNVISLIRPPETDKDKMKRLSRRRTVDPPAVEDVFDPRNSSYGPSYRRYFEPNSGSVRYFYDDVNAVRMPNYISRNHLDMFSFADTTGPLRQAAVNGLGSVRNMAEDTWHESQVNFRTELQARMMRRVNAQAWQRRVAPIRT